METKSMSRRSYWNEPPGTLQLKLFLFVSFFLFLDTLKLADESAPRGTVS